MAEDSTGIQEEISEMLRRMEALTESVRNLVCDRRLPLNTRLMEIMATNRDLLKSTQNIEYINTRLLKAYDLEPLESSEKL